MAYDVFISYRREGGDTLAQLLYDRLTHRGYRVFLDIESLNAGKFNEKLLDVIEECKDVVVVLPPHALDRCVNEGDWVYRELQHAMECSKNIIPVMMKGFEWPENIPEDIADIMNYNGILDNKDYFDAVIDKLTRLMASKPVIGENFFRKMKKNRTVLVDRARRKKGILCGILVCAIACGAVVGIMKYKETQEQKKTESYVSIIVTPAEDMSAVDYNDALTTLEKRFRILADGADMDFTEDKGTIKVSLPMEVFHGIDVKKVMQCYVTRPAEMYLCPDTDDWEDMGSKAFHIDRSAIESVEPVSLPVSEVDTEAYPLQGLEDKKECEALAITLDEETLDEIQDWKEENPAEQFVLAQDCEEFEAAYYYKLLEDEKGDDKLYVLDNYQYDNILKLIQFNYTNDTFSRALRFSIEEPVHWETKKDENVTFGQNQKDIKKLTGQVHRYDFESIQKDMSQGEYDDVIRIFKERLDALGVPYAFGYQMEDPYAICIKTDTRYMNEVVTQGLGSYNSLRIKTDFYDVLNPGNIESVEVKEKDNGTYALEIVPAESWLSYTEKEVEEGVKEDDIVYLCLDDLPAIPLDGKEFSKAFDGEKFVFDGFSSAGLKQIDEKTKYIYDFLKTMQMGDDLPYRYSLQVVFEDKEKNEDDLEEEEDYLIPDSTASEETRQSLEKCLDEMEEIENYKVEAANNGQRVTITVPYEKKLPSTDQMNRIFRKVYENCELGLGKIANVYLKFKNGNTGNYLECFVYVSTTSHSINFQANYGYELSDADKDAFDEIVNKDEFYRQFTISDYYVGKENGHISFQ